MIDDAPAENAGTGLPYSFRDRNKSKEIQQKVFTTFQPSKMETFDSIKPMKHIPHEKYEKLKKKYDRMREKKAQSVLDSYSNQLQRVMLKLPFDKLCPPFHQSIITSSLNNKIGRRNSNRMPVDG